MLTDTFHSARRKQHLRRMGLVSSRGAVRDEHGVQSYQRRRAELDDHPPYTTTTETINAIPDPRASRPPVGSSAGAARLALEQPPRPHEHEHEHEHARPPRSECRMLTDSSLTCKGRRVKPAPPVHPLAAPQTMSIGLRLMVRVYRCCSHSTRSPHAHSGAGVRGRGMMTTRRR